MPDLFYDALEAVPEGLRETAKKDDATGKFVVKVVPAARLDEFRENNIRISQERDTLKATVDTLKPHIGESVSDFLARLAELKAVDQQVKDGKLKGTDAVQAEVDNRIQAMKANYETENQRLNREAGEARRQAAESEAKFQRSIVERAVTEAVVNDRSGALPSALPDILARAYGVFQVGSDGKLTAKNGDATIYGADGTSPMTPLEWMTKLRESAPYFFKGSNGGGAAGGTAQGGQFGGLSREDYTKLSPQAKLELAHKMKQKVR